MIRLLSAVLLVLIAIHSCSPAVQDGFVLYNVKGYTLSENDLLEFEAIAVRGGRVEALGATEEIGNGYPGYEMIDGEGKTLLPGLIDAHAHVMGLGLQELDVNVTGITSLEETLETIREYAEANPEKEWIVGRGWNQVLWEENEFPTAEDLDRVVPGRPVYLTRIDGHAAWANTKAMELAGISRDTPDSRGGVVQRDVQGNATGIFVDAAMSYIRNAIPERTGEDYRRALQLALDAMARHGITSVHDARTDLDTWNLYKQFAASGDLITRIYAMVAGTGEMFDEVSARGLVASYAEDLLALRSVKISADGALGSRGAALLEHYHDDPGNTGLLFYNQDELNGMLLKGAEAGYQMNVHAIGDAANRQVLDALEFVRDELGDQTELRHRIEHAQIVAVEDIPRFAELGIIASMQPTHATSDMNMAEDRIGADRMEGAYAWQAFLDQGTVIAGGSDFPVEYVNPFYGLYSAVTRQDHEGMPPGGWYSEHRMSRTEALRAFTLDAAYAAHQESVIGSLEEGKWADFILIDRDYFEVPASEIWQTDILETWVAGRKVYEKQAASGNME